MNTFNKNLVIEAQIPHGGFTIKKHGEYITNVKKLSFNAAVDQIPSYKVAYGEINPEAFICTNTMKVKIESDGTIMGTCVYINGERQEMVQSVQLNCDADDSNELIIHSYFYEPNKIGG